jgi:hypothetical protein
LPADVGKRLQEAMLAQENLLEDARYFKIAPNDYLVELNEANYNQHYKPVEKLVCEQWREKLLKLLNTTNSRQGRRVYRFGGNVRIRIRPVAELGEDEVRIHCQVNAEVGAVAVEAVLPCLELLAEGRQWPLGEEITVIGRDDGCDVFLDEPLVQLTRLISRRHAYIRREDDHFVLYDGSPEGKASLNGTFVNGQPVLAGGHILQDDDLIILAALEPGHPCLDTPGVAAFRFQTSAHVISRPTVGAKSRSEHP